MAEGILSESKGQFQILGKHVGPIVDWRVSEFPHKVSIGEQHKVVAKPGKERHYFTTWAVDPDRVYYTIGSEKGNYTDFDDLLARCPTCVANLGSKPVLASDYFPEEFKSLAPVNSYIVNKGEINDHPKVGPLLRWKAK